MENLSIRKINELSKKKKKGFTLVELIIVIAIIAILAAIAMPRFGAIRENANVKADIANAKNIQTAISTAISNGDIKLTTGDQTITIATYLEGGTVPKPKASGHTTDSFVATVSSAGLVTVLVGTLQVLPAPSGVYVIS